MSAVDHADAVKALLTTVDVHDGLAPPDAERPYVSLYVHSPRTVGERIAGPKPGAQTTVAAVCVGDTVWESRRMVDKVQTAFNNVRPVITGYVCGPLFQITEGQSLPDQETQLPPYSATEVWRFNSTPT